MADPSKALRYMAATRNAVSNLDRAERAEAEVDRLRSELRRRIPPEFDPPSLRADRG